MAEFAYTLTNLRTRVRYILNEPTENFWLDVELNRWLNDAQRDIAIKSTCIRNIDSTTTTAAQRYVTYNGYKVLYVEYNSIGLPKIHPTQIGRAQTDATGAPAYWFESNGRVYFDPIPDNTYTVYLYVIDYPAAELSDGAPTPTIPNHFRPLMTLYTLSKAYEKDKRYGPSAQLMGMYESELWHARLDRVEIVPDSREVLEWGRVPSK